MVICVENLNKTFYKDGKKVEAVKNVSFSIEAGESVGLIGESGSGKSTLANLIAGFEKADSGKIQFMGKDITKDKKRKENRKKMQMVFQNPILSFQPRCRVIDGISDGIRYIENISKADCQQRVVEILKLVGLSSEYLYKRCNNLSGGQCQRVAIARAMIANPKLVINDEVTSALDVASQAQILSLFSKLKQTMQTSYLFISHDIAVVSCLCDKVMVMKDGQIIENGDTMTVLNNPQEEYTKQLIKAVTRI